MKNMNDQTLKWFEKVNSDLKDNDKFVCILLDILQFDYQSLTENSFMLFLRHFTTKRTLIDLLKGVQILEHPDAVKILFKVNDTVQILEKEIEQAWEWIASEKGVPNRSDERFRTAIDCIKYFSKLLIANSKQDERVNLAVMDWPDVILENTVEENEFDLAHYSKQKFEVILKENENSLHNKEN